MYVLTQRDSATQKQIKTDFIFISYGNYQKKWRGRKV